MTLYKKITRREFLQVAGAAAAATTLAACGGANLPAPTAPAATPEPSSPTADQALALLKDGNARYVAAKMARPNQSTDRRASLSAGQKPFAIIFSCVDSRVPPELAFDRGLGDLFVIRTAGHVIDHAALGSIQYGVEHLHVPLIMVMGHEKCGAVSATIETIEAKTHAEGDVEALVQAIQPAVEKSKNQAGDKLDNAVKANTLLTVEALKANEILSSEVKKGKLVIVGARYDLDTGMVEMVA